MNRRNFFGNLLAATAGFAILPPATTYSRIWRATRQPVFMPFPSRDYYGRWTFVCDSQILIPSDDKKLIDVTRFIEPS